MVVKMQAFCIKAFPENKPVYCHLTRQATKRGIRWWHRTPQRTMSSPVKGREWEKSLTVKCRLCGGAKCKRCSESAALAKTNSPVTGLHADWVTDRILGMMRPSSRLMKEYHIAAQFHKLGIAAVFNLTLPGEHPYCGDGLGSSGFPYDPEADLMAEKIRFYNFGWEDMTTPTLSFTLDIVKVMASILEGGHSKIAVHCHAGYGRTGLVIACCLIFMHNIPPDRAIKIVRRDRPGSIQTSAQAKFVRHFHEYINASNIVFALPLIHDRFTIAEIVDQQNRLVHGEKFTSVKVAVPRVLDVLCREVEKAVEHNAMTVVYGFIFHLLWQGHDGHRSLCDVSEQYTMHGKAVFGEGYTGANLESGTIASTVSSPPSGSGAVPPPPVPANLAHNPHCATQEDLFPTKVAFNVGEWNWHEAITHSRITPTHAPALLLDWLQHLSEPLLDGELVAQVAASPQDNATTKWKPLNQQPSCTFRSLDRVLVCLRHLLRKADSLVNPQSCGSLIDAIYVRMAMALFHFTTATPVVTLYKHADFVKELAREWKAPKRLELNFESLQKFTSGRASISQPHVRSPSIKDTGDTEMTCPATPPPSVSPTRCLVDPITLEPVVQSKVTAEIKLGSPQKSAAEMKLGSPQKSCDLSPLKQSYDTGPQSSPVQPRPPSVELPPMGREKEERAAEPSPVKMESLVPKMVYTDVKKETESLQASHHTSITAGHHLHHHHHQPEVERDAQPLIPTPPPTASPDRTTLHTSASTPSHHTTPPPLSRVPGSGGNVYSLPSVKVSDRYKNRQS